MSWQLRSYPLIQLLSTRFIVVGFAALFWHFAWWLGILFALSAWLAYKISRAIAMEDFKQRPDKYE